MNPRKNNAPPELVAIREQAEPFLRALFSDFLTRGLPGLVEVRTIGPQGVQSRFFRGIENVLDALPKLKAMNDAGGNIYIGVNPRCRERGCQEDVRHVVALHVDADPKTGFEPERLARLGAIQPSVLVGSGRGQHLYWLLREPLEVSDDAICARVRGINAALAAVLGGDNCHDLSRVLRLPGFRNVKPEYPDKPIVHLLSCQPDNRYQLDELSFLHPTPIPSAKPAFAQVTSDDQPQLSPRVRELIENDTDVARRWRGETDGLNDTSASALDLSLAALLSHRDCTDKEIADALRLATYNVGRQNQLTANYLNRTISRARRNLRTRTGGNKKEERESQGSLAVKIFEAEFCDDGGARTNCGDGRGAPLFHTPAGVAYASIVLDGHRQTFALKSHNFRALLSKLLFEKQGKAPSSEALRSAIGVLEGHALFDGPEIPVSVRIAERDGAIYLDLGDPKWRAIEVRRDGWRVVEDPPVRFRRPRGMRALPDPIPGGDPQELLRFVNLKSRAAQNLFLFWVIGTFSPRGPYPILAIHGGQGSAKSTLSAVVRQLLDPSEAPLRTAPRDERDLMIAATNAHVICLDNLSSIPPWLSDALCRLATGGGLATRELYTDDEEVIFDAQRPVLLNGIEELSGRGDLLDRAIILELPPILKTERRDEEQFWKEFETARPRILGALLSATSVALRNISSVKLRELPRMADFARWSVAAEPALGFEPGEFMASYDVNIAEANQAALESSAVAVGILDFLSPGDSWEGTAGELLEALGQRVGEQARKEKHWPKTPRGLVSALARARPNLATAGVSLERLAREARTGRRRLRLSRVEEGTSPSSPPSSGDEVQPVTGESRCDGRDESTVTTSSSRKSPVSSASDGGDGGDGRNSILEGEL